MRLHLAILLSLVVGLPALAGCTFSGASGSGGTGGPDSGAEMDAGPDATPATATFQLGQNGYAGTVDTFITQGLPGLSYGSETRIETDQEADFDGGEEQWGLLRFNDLIGSVGIPLNSRIVDATLTLTITDAGDSVALHDLLVPWEDDVTWDNFVEDQGFPISGSHYTAIPAAMLAEEEPRGSVQLDVISSVEEWAQGADNFGWFLIPGGSNAVYFNSTEGGAATSPELTVSFLPPE